MGIDRTWKKDQELLQGAAVLTVCGEGGVSKGEEQTVDYKAAIKFKNRNVVNAIAQKTQEMALISYYVYVTVQWNWKDCRNLDKYKPNSYLT